MEEKRGGHTMIYVLSNTNESVFDKKPSSSPIFLP